MSQKIYFSVNELKELVGRLKNTSAAINNNVDKAINAAKSLKNECDSLSMFFVPYLKNFAIGYEEGMKKRIEVLEAAIEVYVKVDREIGKKIDYIEADNQIRKELSTKFNHEDMLLINDIVFAPNKLSLVKGEHQHHNSAGEGTCTTVANVTLVNRLLSYKGLEPTFTYEQARLNQKNKSPYNFSKKDPLYYTVDGTDQKYKVVEKSTRGEGFESNKDYIIHLLDKHPEGIQFYAKYKGGNHAITISRYEKVGDEYKFYAYDGVGNGKGHSDNESHMSQSVEMDLEKTYLFSNRKSSDKTVDDLLNNSMKGIMYLNDVTETKC